MCRLAANPETVVGVGGAERTAATRIGAVTGRYEPRGLLRAEQRQECPTGANF